MANSEHNGNMDMKDGGNEGDGGNSRYDAKTAAYMEDLLKEKHILNTSIYPIASRLIDEEFSRTKQSGQASRDYRYVDIFREKPIKVVAKVMVPIREYPKFNFVGKLLGPKGNTLRRLQEETFCKMTILGRGSMKDKAKEEELRKGLDPKYSHLSDDLHVEVSALAPPSEAHARMSYALKELRKYLIPDANDEISQEQLRELESYGMEGGVEEVTENKSSKPPYALNRGPKGPPAAPGASRAKVMSILEKARNAMEKANSYHPPPAVHHQNSHERRTSSRAYEEYSEEYESPRYEERSRRDWSSGYKVATPPSRYFPRSTPYGRP